MMPSDEFLKEEKIENTDNEEVKEEPKQVVADGSTESVEVPNTNEAEPKNTGSDNTEETPKDSESVEESEETSETSKEQEDESEWDKFNGPVITPYFKKNFLMFGKEDYPENIDIDGTIDYLKTLGLDNNFLEQARTGNRPDNIALGDAMDDETAIYCDFCYRKLYGIEYEQLEDGRKRCMRCSRTAIRTKEEFVELFEQVKRNMEVFFGIRFTSVVNIEMANAEKIQRLCGERFVPGQPRALGLSIAKSFFGRTKKMYNRAKYELLIENGSPRMKSIITMAHELTHIWQYTHWDRKKLEKKYGKKAMLILEEGMAMWVQIQYAYLINEKEVAEMELRDAHRRPDEYGIGFRLYEALYGLTKGNIITTKTPFTDVDSPLGDIDLRGMF